MRSISERKPVPQIVWHDANESVFGRKAESVVGEKNCTQKNWDDVSVFQQTETQGEGDMHVQREVKFSLYNYLLCENLLWSTST